MSDQLLKVPSLFSHVLLFVSKVPPLAQMKAKTVLLGFFGAQIGLVSVVERNSCNADNCFRGVRGTAIAKSQPPLSSRQADCARYMTRTVTPTAM